MVGKARFMAAVAASVLLLVLLTGCTVEGGGWFVQANGGKGAVGVDVAIDDDGIATGDIQFVDHATGIRFHATPFQGAVNGPQAYVWANYTPQPPVDSDGNVRPGGSFQMYIYDSGTPGSEGDFIAFNFYGGGLYDGAAVSGNLRGGNLTISQ